LLEQMLAFLILRVVGKNLSPNKAFYVSGISRVSYLLGKSGVALLKNRTGGCNDVPGSARALAC